MMIYPLKNHGDPRGFFFSLPPQALEFLGTVQEMHIVELVPNAIRGNHYHQQHKEVLLVFYEDDWLLAWQAPEDEKSQQQIFSGQGAVLITLEANTAHTLKNIGDRKMIAISCSNRNAPDDTVRQMLLDFP